MVGGITKNLQFCAINRFHSYKYYTSVLVSCCCFNITPQSFCLPHKYPPTGKRKCESHFTPFFPYPNIQQIHIFPLSSLLISEKVHVTCLDFRISSLFSNPRWKLVWVLKEELEFGKAEEMNALLRGWANIMQGWEAGLFLHLAGIYWELTNTGLDEAMNYLEIKRLWFQCL